MLCTEGSSYWQQATIRWSSNEGKLGSPSADVRGNKGGMEGVGKSKRTTLRSHTVVLTRGTDCLLTSFSADIRSSSSSLIRCSLSGSSWHGCKMRNEEKKGKGRRRDGENEFTGKTTNTSVGFRFHIPSRFLFFLFKGKIYTHQYP